MEKIVIRISHAVFAVLILCTGGGAPAGEFAYTCEVSYVYSLADNALLERLSALEKIMKENSFSVSRETGALVGNSATLDTSLAKSTRVINRGSKENSFTAVADFGAFANGTHPYQLIEIEEFKQGVNKPFVLMGARGVITGVCK